jgi:dethiobiotin synthetase
MGVYFVTGIDTGIGKSVATGLMARWLAQRGCTVITQKLVQTGCRGPVAEDIAVHRRLMGTGLLDVDDDGTTCPCILAYPASPHLAARLENREVDIAAIDRATDRLAAMYEHVLVEGVGGVLVPLAGSMTVLDYVARRGYPLIVVGSLRLGSVNHTLLTLEAAQRRGVEVRGLVLNLHHPVAAEIAADSRQVFAEALLRYGFPQAIVEIPGIGGGADLPTVDFAPLFGDLPSAPPLRHARASVQRGY